jgi:hypothetical protein
MGAAEVQAEVDGKDVRTGQNAQWHAAEMFRNGPAHLRHVAYSLQDKVSHAAKEITLFLGGRKLDSDELQALLDDPEHVDTNLGHSINAASLARINHLILVRLAEKLDVDISDIE